MPTEKPCSECGQPALAIISYDGQKCLCLDCLATYEDSGDEYYVPLRKDTRNDAEKERQRQKAAHAASLPF